MGMSERPLAVNLWFGLKELTVLIDASGISQLELEMLAGSVLNNMGLIKLFTDIDIAPRIYKICGAPISFSSTRDLNPKR